MTYGRLKQLTTRVAGCALAGLPVALLAVTAPTTEAAAETLKQALVRAYNANPRLRAARATLRATDEQMAQAFANWRPTVRAIGQAGRRVSKSSPGTNLYTTPYSGRLTLDQPLFRGGSSFAQLRRARNNIRAQRARLIDTEQDVLLDAVTAYMNVFRDEAVLRLNINNQRVLRRQLRATRDRFEVGEVTRTDVAQAQARLARATADRIQSEGDLESSRANYKNVIGAVPVNVRRPQMPVRVPKSRGQLIRISRQSNPNVIAALFTEASARSDVANIRGELLPQISISGEASRSFDSSFRNTRSDAASVTAQVVIPLYQAGSVTSRLRAAKQTASQRRMELIQARRESIEAATRAWASLLTARSQVQAFESEVRANQIALEGVRQEARAGSRTVLDVLDAQQELLTSQVSLVRVQRDETVARHQVRAAMGRLTSVTLRLPVKAYDARQYYRDVRYKLWGLGRSSTRPPKRK